MKAPLPNSNAPNTRKKTGLIISLIALAHFLFTWPFQMALGLSFSIKEYQFLKPAFDFLTIPEKWIIRTGIFDGLSRQTSNTLVFFLAILSAFLYALLYYVIGLLLIRVAKNLGQKRNQTPKQA